MERRSRGGRRGGVPKLALTVAIVLGAAAAAPQLQAKPSWKEVAAANQAAAKGRAAEKRGDYAAALEAYEESGSHVDSSANRRRLARAKAGLGRLLEARAELEHVLNDQTASKGQQKKARKELDELVARIPRIDVQLPPGFSGQLELDGEAFTPSGEPQSVNPGRHSLRATAEGYRDFELELELQEGESKQAHVELEPLPEPSASPPIPSAEPDSTSLARPLGYVSLGVGVVGVALGSYFGLQAKSTRDELGDACVQDRCPTELKTKYDDGKQQALFSTIGFAVGGAGLVTGVVLLLLAPSETEQGPVQAGIGPDSVWVTGRF
ncbi:MAG: tetratricopeptide repeat protein [Polyangiaceae bacterium]